ncbi:hypothetical protein SAMN04489712_109101 [Thermomonospora echinospora]|uniref:Uncharacterized protein n=1 Tax=Thermomonospora echinospora TaxID=1992 RepID=A0A1H6C9G6_9ACTN|nr:hypothetical protein [Thermomonospora echinospora]SEG69611.1 hypothetical protein SAMN04489712_109101 [Thermomonospora echinospora]
MTEAQDAWDTLLEAGFLHALRDAHEATTRIVLGALSRAAGFKDRSFGYTSFDVLESQLDQAFGIDPPRRGAGGPLAGRVVRENLNGSPGWRLGAYRVLLKRHEFGAVDAIRWDQDSPTKQAVSRQDFPGDPQLTLDLGISVRPAAAPVTLVLAHSATDEPIETELFIGRPRYNADAGSPWWWRRPLTAETLGPDPRRIAEPTMPLWSDDTDGVPLRLREPGAATDGTAAEAAR